MIGCKQDGPTKIYGDNISACLIANKRWPTERAWHVDIQYFAIQEWTERRIIELDHIPGKVNYSDALTKALGYVLHHWHCTRMMGYAGSPYSNTYAGFLWQASYGDSLTFKNDLCNAHYTFEVHKILTEFGTEFRIFSVPACVTTNRYRKECLAFILSGSGTEAAFRIGCTHNHFLQFCVVSAKSKYCHW